MGIQATHKTDLFTPFSGDISEIELAENILLQFNLVNF